MHRSFAIAVACCLIAMSAHASRSCLDKRQAARTWPTKELIKDDDGCWTYRRAPKQEEAPADTRVEVPVRILKVMRTTPEGEKTWSERWPDVEIVPRKPASVEPDAPLMSARNVVSVILVVVLVCALAEVSLGLTTRKPLKPGRKRRV